MRKRRSRTSEVALAHGDEPLIFSMASLCRLGVTNGEDRLLSSRVLGHDGIWQVLGTAEAGGGNVGKREGIVIVVLDGQPDGARTLFSISRRRSGLSTSAFFAASRPCPRRSSP